MTDGRVPPGPSAASTPGAERARHGQGLPTSAAGGRGWVALLGVFALYFIGAKLGLSLAFFHPSATPVWPPTGIAIASLLLLGLRVWPAIFLGAFLANITLGTVWTSLGIAAGNTLEGVIGASLVAAYANGKQAFNRWQDVFGFAALGATVSTAVSATIGVTSLALGGLASWTDYRPIWLTWWLGDATGALIFTPLLLLWAQGPPVHWRGRQILERAVFLAVLLPVAWIVFGGLFAFAFLTVPFLIWAAFRFEQPETAAVIVLLSILAVLGALQGRGPFAGATVNESLLLLQTFMGLMVLVALPLSSMVRENALRIASERRARREAEAAVGRAARLQAVTSALSGAVTRAQVVDVILRQGILALGARAGWVSVVNDSGDALLLEGHAGGYPDEFVAEVRSIPLSAERPTTEAFKTGQPLFYQSAAPMRARFPEVNVFYEDAARAAIPLSTAGGAIGVLVLNFPGPRTLDEDDWSLMLTLAQQCAQALERAQFYDREHYVARTLQQAFLPGTLPDVPGIQIDAVYMPGAGERAVGGDWYDVFRLSDGRIAVSVGDVVGSGVEAAVMMGQVRQSIRAAALEGHGPDVVLARAGHILRLTYEREGMATAVFGTLDPAAATFTYAIAGHPAPALATADGEIQTLAQGTGPLGIGDAKPSPVRTVMLPVDGLLALYTDGLIESTRNLPEGEALLFDALRAEQAGPSTHPAQGLVERIMRQRPPTDDVAVVTISICGSPLEELALTLPAAPASTRRVRQAVEQLARSLRLDRDLAFKLQVAVGEAVNNTVEHAYGASEGTFDLRVWRDARALHAEVTDRGQWRPEREEGQGRGLTIMRALAEAVRVDRQPAGTTVNLDWPLAEPAAPEPAAPAAHAASRVHSTERGALVRSERRAVPAGAYPRFQEGRFAVGELYGIPVLNVSGDVDLNNARLLGEQLEAAARVDKRAVVVSLNDASFFDSTAIHVLLRFERRLATNRQRLLLAVGRDQPARRIIELTGISQTIPVFDSAEAAVAAAQGR